MLRRAVPYKPLLKRACSVSPERGVVEPIG
jgi:hypothetical protein